MVLQRSQSLFRRKLTHAIALPIALLLLLAGVSIWQITRLLSALRWVDHTSQVISHANQVQKLLLDMETGFRGYLLTGQQVFLEPYDQANVVIEPNLEELRTLVSDNPNQVQRVHELTRQLQQWEAQVLPAIHRKRQGEREPLSSLMGRKQRMDQMRREISAFITTEEQLQEQRSHVAQQTTHSVILTSLLLASGIGVVMAYFIFRQIFRVSQTYEDALHTAQVRTEQAEQSAIALQRSAQRLSALHNIDRAILAAESDKTLVGNALDRLRQIIPYQQAFVTVFDFENETVNVLAGSDEINLNHPPLTLHDVVADQNQGQKIRYIDNLTTTNLSSPILTQLRAQEFSSYLSIPLQVENTVIGELHLASVEPAAFDGETQEIAQEVAAQLAIALQQSRLRAQLQEYAAQLEERVAERTLQLQETNQELEAFTYSVSHDLRAPLRTMQGFANALLEDCGDQLDGYCTTYIHSIIEDAVQMNGLINDLLAYSRLTRLQILLQPVSLDEVVHEALKQLTVQIQEKNAQILVKEGFPRVIAHRSTLVQVVINLISNAVKFVEADIQPQIDIFTTIERQDKQDWIRLWIVDNGIGIAPEHQERVFRVFERLHGNESYPGTGIGLAIVHKGLERMGGQVGVDSQLGHGSRFWIALPSAVLAGSNAAYDPNSPSSGN